MESLDTQTMETNRNIPGNAMEHINKSGKWMKIVAVFGFIGCGFMVLAALIILIAGDTLNSFSGAAMGTGALGAFYLVGALLYLFPTMMLWQSGNAYRNYYRSPNENDISTAFMKQGNMFQFIGVLTIIFMSFVILMMVAGGAFLYSMS